jgi:hypothetical protein
MRGLKNEKYDLIDVRRFKAPYKNGVVDVVYASDFDLLMGLYSELKKQQELSDGRRSE